MDSNSQAITLLHPKYEEVIESIIKSHFKKSKNDFNITYNPGSFKGDNFIGIIHRIDVRDKVTNESKLNLVVKLPPESATKRTELLINVYFKCEAYFYDYVYPLYQKFQIQKGIDIEKNGFNEVPHCYKSLTVEPYEGLFLEDLKSLGFQMFDRSTEVTKEHVLLVMKTLAKMHGLFFVINDCNPRLVEKCINIKDPFISLCDRENAPLDPYFNNLKEQTFNVIDKSKNRKMVDKINKLLEKNIGHLLKSCLIRESIEPYGTLCHGDCTNNNILFLYDKDGIPVDIKFLDFQIIRYASPVCDIVHYIFACTSKELRDLYYHEFLDAYYNELSLFIQKLGSDPTKLFPRNVFNDHLKKFGHFGLLMAIIVLPLFTSDAAKLPDMEDIAKTFKKVGEKEKVDENAFKYLTDKSENRYATRMMGVCEDMDLLGYI